MAIRQSARRRLRPPKLGQDPERCWRTSWGSFPLDAYPPERLRLLYRGKKRLPRWGIFPDRRINGMPRTLREIVKDLEGAGRLVRLEEEIDANLEAAEIQRRVYASGGPAVLFA